MTGLHDALLRLLHEEEAIVTEAARALCLENGDSWEYDDGARDAWLGTVADVLRHLTNACSDR